jgi:hypothetical protein
MTKLLSLFIEPSYDDWTKIHGYGEEFPANSGRIADHIYLQTDRNDLRLLAACPGRLSVHPPSAVPRRDYDLPTPDLSQPLPATVDLYLHLTPLAAFDPVLTARVAALRSVDWPVMTLTGFVYYHVDTAALKDDIADLLRGSTVPPAADNSDLEARMRLFVQGHLDVFVGEAGLPMGLPAPLPDDSTRRRVRFGALTSPVGWDPAHLYDQLRDMVEQELEVDQFLNVVPLVWPVLGPALNKAQAMAATESKTYPLAVLEQMRADHDLSPVEWRQVGENQKALLHKRLLARTGHLPAGETAPPFDFNYLDLQNLFQMEAVVEFYANFPDPWDTTTAPRARTDPNFIRVNFVPPEGTAATVGAGPDILALDAGSDLSAVRPGEDIIVTWTAGALPDPTNTHYYRINAVNGLNVTVGANVSGAGPFQWRILTRPILVLIDSFAGRMRGEEAVATAGSATITLNDAFFDVYYDAAQDRYGINRNLDTIYLPNDTARASRTYRITNVDYNNDTVTLDGVPSLQGNRSPWHIPAGVSGDMLPTLAYNLGPGGNRGYDHYDGVMFVIYDGSVQAHFRWTSYTSRTTTGESCSSVLGNRRYYYHSLRAGSKEFINFAFHVGNPAPADPHDPLPGRNYFGRPINVTAACTVDANGKTEIFIHDGNRNAGGTGSEGCIVSPHLYRLRDQMIQILQQELVALNEPGNATHLLELDDKLLYEGRAGSQAFFGNAGPPPDAQFNTSNTWAANYWNDVLQGDFWLIRPDERPIT